jgi:hypothetical protein
VPVNRLEQPVDDDRAAVAVELDDLFTRVGMRRGEIERQAAIDFRTFAILESTELGDPGQGAAPRDAMRDSGSGRSRDAHDGNGTRAGGGRERSNRVVGRGQHG